MRHDLPRPAGRRLAALTLLCLALATTRDAPAQRAQAPAAPAGATAWRIAIQHSFPLAGGPLVLVVDGLAAGEHVALKLSQPAEAPPSMTTWLAVNAVQVLDAIDAPDSFMTLWRGDPLGRVVLEIPLLHPDDANRPITLSALALDGSSSEPLHLQVQPPTLVVAAGDGLQRISLLDGALLQPPIPPEGGLRSLALSADGVLGYVLRNGGLLETRATHRWDGEPLSRRELDPATDLLAGSPAGGAAFALARPSGAPFTPAAHLQFLDARRAPLLLEPMGQAVSGRRAVVTPDGLTAFVAEDNLILREVDLAAGRAESLLAVGMAGDGAIADMVLDGRSLLVATRGPLGRRGSLTTFDLDSGVLLTHALAVDPLRLVPLGAERVLVVPAAGAEFQIVERGLPAALHATPAGRWLDAVARAGGALLLRESADGAHALDTFDPVTGRLSPLVDAGLPPVTRLVAWEPLSAGTATGPAPGVVLLLGDPAGAVHVLRDGAVLDAVPGLEVLPGGAFAVLP